jgi:hypothetical protein
MAKSDQEQFSTLLTTHWRLLGFMTFSNIRWAAIVLPFFMFSASSAFATFIFVSNPSFETLPVGGLPQACSGSGCFLSKEAIPGWDNSGNSGQFQPGVQDGNHIRFDTLDAGITSAWSDGPTISQTVGATVLADVTYTLQVDIGCRIADGCLGDVDLLINGNTYLATGTRAPEGNWSTFTATYIGQAADVGSAITIELQSSGTEGNFDNVRLDAVAPEPGFMGIVGVALAGIIAARRKLARRRS